VSGVGERLQRARARIAAAAARAGRDPAAVTLVGVTKGVDVARIQEALAAGLRDLGENRIQEALPKIAALGPGPRWHFVGRLQRNKARWAAEAFDLVHSVDSLSLADALERAAARAGRRVRVLIEVNVAGEPTKGGVAPDEAEALVAAVRARAHLEPAGLMTVAPAVGDPEQVRPVFRALRELGERIRAGPGGATFGELSMGMSDDFEVAVEEGATLVRLGRAIFGPRGTGPRERPGVRGEEGAQEV
jgi:pyridoxal phosphate enzyme (YggS family)